MTLLFRLRMGLRVLGLRGFFLDLRCLESGFGLGLLDLVMGEIGVCDLESVEE
jgi:hypothetical protein